MTKDSGKIIRLEDRRPGASAGAMARVHDRLPVTRPVEAIDEILSRDDAEDYIKSLNPHGLYRLIREAGFDQGMDLIPYTAPEQLQIFVDLDCWKRDHIDTDRMAAWLAVMVADADDAHFKAALRDLDPEVVSLFFKKNLRAVEIVEEGEIPPGMPDPVELSPDNAYAISYPEDEDLAALLRALLQRLYDQDMGLAWTLLESVRWELESDMEETAYRFRSSRLEEFGFVERTEALEVYALLDPVKLRDRWEQGNLEKKIATPPPEQLEVPAVLREAADERLYFFEILNELDDDAAIALLIMELATLTNRTLIADGIEPGELETGGEVVRRTAGFLSLGLEFLSRADHEKARQGLETVPLKTLFRLGHAIAQNLRQKARNLKDRPTLTLVESVPFSLLNPDEAALFEGLEDLRPTYGRDAERFEIFQEQAQVDDAALRIGMVAFKQLWLFGVQQAAVEDLAPLVYDGAVKNDPDQISFDVFFSTALSTFLLTGEPALRGLSRAELTDLPRVLREAAWSEDPVAFFEPLIGPMLVALPAATASMTTRWLNQTLELLVEELAGVEFVDELEPFFPLVLVANP